MYFFEIVVLVFFKYLLRNRTARSYGSSIFILLRNLYTVFCSIYCNLHTHQQCGRVHFSQYPHQHLFLYTSLFVFLICISLMINYAEHLFMHCYYIFFYYNVLFIPGNYDTQYQNCILSKNNL